jgi:hypothetical protein
MYPMITIAASASIHVLIGLVGAWMIYLKNGSMAKYKYGSTMNNGTGYSLLLTLPPLVTCLQASNGSFDGDVIGRVVWFAAWVPGVIVVSGNPNRRHNK